MRHLSATGLLIVGLLAATDVRAQGTYKKDLPAALAKKATITEDAAAKSALARVPGAIQAVELEEENGKLIYSYDIKVATKSGIEEVAVSATTGKIISVEHETPEDEAKETAAEKSQSATAKKSAKPTATKPPAQP